MNPPPKSEPSTQNVDLLMLRSIDETFSLLGEAAKSKLYFHLENTFGIKKTEILFHTEEFYSALERIFGASAGQLETLLLRKLQQNLGQAYVAAPVADCLPANAAYIPSIPV